MTDSILTGRHTHEATEMWQARALRAARGKLGAVLLSVLAHSWPDDLPVFCRLAFPGYRGIAPPFLASCGKIMTSGIVVADMVDRQGARHSRVPLFANEAALEGRFRRLADELKFTDADRVDMFAAVGRWIVADFRLDPATGENERAA